MSAEPAPGAEAVTQTAFAKLVGVSRQRIGQMIREGLPTRDGRIPVEEARAWIAAEKRLYGNGANVAARIEARAAKERADADLAELKLAERQGKLVDREAVRRIAFERARFERDAHLGFAARAAPLIAAEAGGDVGVIFAALDKVMREHLLALAEAPTPERTP